MLLLLLQGWSRHFLTFLACVPGNLPLDGLLGPQTSASSATLLAEDAARESWEAAGRCEEDTTGCKL